MRSNMFAKVILASKPTNSAPPIITMHWRYPRIIHAEIMTHRVFSRNARSSRAVPVAKMLEEIRNDPFVPWHWGKNQKGMQAGESFAPDEIVELQKAWLVARDNAFNQAEGMKDFGVHKQIANRLLEPFMWIDTLVTSTSWANFLHLRDHKDAEPHFQDLARLIRQALLAAEPQTLESGRWHLPYITPHDRDLVINIVGNGDAAWKIDVDNMLLKLSTARCARISYKPFDGDGSIESEIRRHDDLVGSKPLHASPTEHQASPDTFDGMGNWAQPEKGGNLGPGWIQYRKTLPGEYVGDAA